MYHDAIEAQGFTGRKAGLQRIKRWKSFSPAWYRHDLEMHTLEVRFLLEAVLPEIKQRLPTFNIERARILALVHDDPEIVSKNGDVELNKKLNMTLEELSELEQEEAHAIDRLVARWPENIHGYNYRSLLEEAKQKATRESQVLSYLDKCSALCESLHELYAGNKEFHKNWQSERKRPPIAGTNVIEVAQKYSQIAPLLSIPHPFFPPFVKPAMPATVEAGTPHTPLTLTQPTGLPHYDFWRNTMRAHGGAESLAWLTKRQEV